MYFAVEVSPAWRYILPIASGSVYLQSVFCFKHQTDTNFFFWINQSLRVESKNSKAHVKVNTFIMNNADSEVIFIFLNRFCYKYCDPILSKLWFETWNVIIVNISSYFYKKKTKNIHTSITVKGSHCISCNMLML